MTQNYHENKNEADIESLRITILEEQIAEFRKENAELKDGTILKELTEKCKKQAEQIEKMKCCGNCKHWICAEDYDGKSYYCEKYMETCDNLNKWELAE